MNMATPASIAQSRPQDWLYLSEGGSTIVFSHTGPFHPQFTGRVLRLRKISNRNSLDGAEGASLDNTVYEEDDLLVAFQNIVLTLLVPLQFLPKLDVVLLDAEWLTALEMLRDGDRPTERRAKDKIDKNRRKGILATDLIGGADILAVEIKPKWGFMPNPAHLSQETAEVKMNTCRFCMHACYKAGGGVLTQYCPLDLYSGDETRMRKAIRDLWNGWMRSNGTLNNMKVFVSGKMIRPSESYHSLLEILSAETEVHEALATALLPLLRTPVLRIISDLQRSLDALDIEGITKLYAMSYPNAKGLLGGIKRDPSVEEWQDFAASYHSVYCTLDHSKLCPENIEMYLRAYLLSATFKDCSIICRMRRSGVSEELSLEPDGIFIIDLDLKGVDQFEKWALIDRDIVGHYRDGARNKLCVE